MLIFAVNVHGQTPVSAVVAQISWCDGENGFAVESRDADVEIVLQIAAVEEPSDGGVRDGFGPAGQVNRMVIPSPSFPHRSQGKSRREFDRDVTVTSVISTLGF